jgi:peptidoglycan/LPS O-acetylase OafA/YrhL
MKVVRIPALTGLRFVAAMMVLIGHAWAVLRFTGDAITGRFLGPLPSMGMTLFFVLSGFVMWVNYAESFRERFWPSLWRFSVARFARLYPLYLAVGLFALVGTNWADLPNELPDALLFIPLLQAWVPGSIPTSAVFAIPQLAHAWSISVEMFLYLCFPAIALLMIGVRSRRVLLGLALSNVVICIVGIWFYGNHIPGLATRLASSLTLPAANMWIGYYSPLTRINEFVAGCIVGAMIARSRTGEAPGWHNCGLIACLTVLAFVVALYSIPTALSQGTVTAALRAGPLAGFAYLIWFLARFDTRAARILSTSTMIAGGEISYSIYLLHPFVLPWFVKPEMEFSAANFGLWIAVLATAIGAVLVMSYGTWALIEVPCRRWLRDTLTSTLPTAELAVSVPAKLSLSDSETWVLKRN